MHSSLPLLALSLLGALALPATGLAQHAAEGDSAGAAGSLIAVAATKARLQAEAPAKPAPRVLTGNVVDEWGKPLMGATVMVVGEKERSVSTNSEGNYLLTTTAVAPVIKVSFGGYHDGERIARGPADLLFKLEPIVNYKRDLKKRSKAAVKAWKH